MPDKLEQKINEIWTLTDIITRTARLIKKETNTIVIKIQKKELKMLKKHLKVSIKGIKKCLK